MSILKYLLPEGKWRKSATLISGIMLGLVIYIMYISNVASYLSDDPKTCLNCHVMGPEYATWFHSAHRENATCNDCHVPHDNIFNTYYFKAKDGLRHSYVFTMRSEPQVIQIKEEGAGVVQQNCVRCHTPLFDDSKIMASTKGLHSENSEDKCWTCHRETPHGRVKGLSSTPHAKVPTLNSPVPKWLQELTK